MRFQEIVESQHKCPHCGGPVVEYSELMEKKDACYYKVKASAKVWPSAYASGRLVQCRKKGAGNYGNKSEGMAEGVRDLGYDAQSLITKLRRDVEEKRLQPTRQAVLMAARELAGDMDFAPELLVRQVLGQGVAEAQLDEKCWDGYQQQGMKNKGGRQVPNCVPTESVELSEEFDLIENIIEGIAEHNGVDAETVWADLESLTEDELYAFAVTSQLNEDWQKANKKDKTDGMSQKAVNAYRRENPGSKLKTAVTTKPSKLKKGGKASKRRKSYCSRSRGQMKMHSISCAKTPDKAICKARRRWNC
jgi:hypothetical protein